jgi:8-oxo-dGTP pyrophosphatase MutT (NUDIX family)
MDPVGSPIAAHACAIITDQRGWLLFELRPPTARYAPNRLACFGGKVEPGEDLRAALHRELGEELGWQPDHGTPICDLLRGPDRIARFFACRWPTGVHPRCLPGVVPIWAPHHAVPGLPLTPWHRCVLDAVASGQERAEVPRLPEDRG